MNDTARLQRAQVDALRKVAIDFLTAVLKHGDDSVIRDARTVIAEAITMDDDGEQQLPKA